VVNLIKKAEFSELSKKLEEQLISELRTQNDPRIFGKGAIFDNYIYSHEHDRNFHKRQMGGEKLNAVWVNKSDFEKEIIKE